MQQMQCQRQQLSPGASMAQALGRLARNLCIWQHWQGSQPLGSMYQQLLSALTLQVKIAVSMQSSTSLVCTFCHVVSNGQRATYTADNFCCLPVLWAACFLHPVDLVADRSVDGWIGWWTDGLIDWVIDWVSEWVIDGWMDGWMHGWIAGLLDGWLDCRMDWLIDGLIWYIDSWIDWPNYSCINMGTQ